MNAAALLAYLLLLFFFFTFQSVDSVQRTRIRRSPDSERIERWKLAFSGDLAPLPRVLPTVSCNWALHELCLKHVSCRELWALFRRNCLVDAQNNCLMGNKNDCWQSFEGISWTGLGSCACPGNNSDCHWIRLQTNYNKCVYLLSHDTSWHAALNSPAQFYANKALFNGHNNGNGNGWNSSEKERGRMEEEGGIGVNGWKAEEWNGWQRKSREEEERKRREEEEEKRRTREEEVRRKSREEEEKRRAEEDEIRRRRIEEEDRKRKMRKEEEERMRKTKEEEGMKRARDQEERMKRIRAEEERRGRMKAEEENRRRMMKEGEERKRKQQEEKDREERMNARRKMMEEEAEMRRRKQKEEEEKRKMEEKRNKEEEEKRKDEEEEEGRKMKGDVKATISRPTALMASNGQGGRQSTEEAREGGGEEGEEHHALPAPANNDDGQVVYYQTVGRPSEMRRGGEGGRDGRRHPDERRRTTAKLRTTATMATDGHPLPPPTSPPASTFANATPTQAEQLVTQAEAPPTWATKWEKGKTTNQREQEEEEGEKQQLNNNIQHQRGAEDDGAVVMDERPLPSGTCPEVLAICERDESACKWHLSELLIKCPAAANNFSVCHRSAQCSAALSRFVRFVPGPLAEAMLFCSPAAEGGNEIPIVLRHRSSSRNCSSSLSSEKKPKARRSCTQTAQMCRAEPRCSRLLAALRSACPSSFTTSSNSSSSSSSTPPPPSCSASSLAKCRSALTAIRGTWLDEPCHCSTKRAIEECRRWENVLWTGNPCIPEVRQDFNELFLAGQLEIEPSGSEKMPPKAKVPTSGKLSSTPKKSASIMELGDEVTLLPAAEEEEEGGNGGGDGKDAIGKVEKGKPNRTGQKAAGSKAGRKLTTTETRNRKKSTAATSKTTTTSTMAVPSTTAPFAEELVDEAAEDNEKEREEEEDKLQIEAEDAAMMNSSRLSYELAKGGGGEEEKAERNGGNGTSGGEGGKEASGTTKMPKKTKWATTTSRGDDDGEEEQMAVTTGRQPLPEFDYATQKPPSEGDGCRTRNVDGEWVEHYPESVFRQFHDWAGRCSSWCECLANGSAQCHQLGCLSDVLCEARHTTVAFGQRLYLGDRGACQCHEGRFICDSSELRPELGPGLYISLGYAKAELDLIREKVPKPVLERSGLISQSSSSLVKDLATRLQFALERVLPAEMQCRVAVLEHFPPEQVVLMQLQWFGVDPSVNNSRAKWHSGKMEKHCSRSVHELELTFLLEKADRYQLLLSTIKQIRVIDLLDALPPNSAQRIRNHPLMMRMLIPTLFTNILVNFLLFRLFPD